MQGQGVKLIDFQLLCMAQLLLAIFGELRLLLGKCLYDTILLYTAVQQLLQWKALCFRNEKMIFFLQGCGDAFNDG